MNKRAVVKYCAAILIFAFASLCFLLLRGAFSTEYGTAELFGILSDAFALPGIIGIMVFLLVWISSTGFFDTLSYGLNVAARSFIPGMRIYRDEKFADYKERKDKNRPKGYSFLLVVGSGFTLVGVIFLILYLRLA